MKKKIIVRPGSFQAWLLACRPKTLSGAAMPVMLSLVLSWYTCAKLGITFRWTPAVLCFLFAIVMQVLANFVNDYFDYVHGLDGVERLGPRRACASGWLSLQSMRIGIGVCIFMAGIVGLPLIYYGGWWMLAVGIGCVVLCFFYTLGGAGHALGDVLVLLCFGLIPVCIPYWIELGFIATDIILFGIACGCVVDTLLIINNYRDFDNDSRCGKFTLAVLSGRIVTEWLYLLLPVAGWLLMSIPCIRFGWWCTLFFPFIYFIRHFIIWRRMCSIGSGKALNNVLAATSVNMLLFGSTVIVGRILDN